MEQFFETLNRFEEMEDAIERDLVLFNMRNVHICKKLCRETLAPVDVLHFAVVRRKVKFYTKDGSQNHSEKVLMKVSKFCRQSVNKLVMLKENQ